MKYDDDIFNGTGGKVEKESFYDWMIRRYCREESEEENDVDYYKEVYVGLSPYEGRGFSEGYGENGDQFLPVDDYEQRENVIDLAEDMKADAEFPKTESWFGIRRYLSLCGAGYDVLHTFDDCFYLYCWERKYGG